MVWFIIIQKRGKLSEKGYFAERDRGDAAATPEKFHEGQEKQTEKSTRLSPN
jgi:hypothetical protein